MSLLDQLSSLCVPTFSNFNSAFCSLDDYPSKQQLPIDAAQNNQKSVLNHDNQQNNPLPGINQFSLPFSSLNSTNPRPAQQSSQRKMIKLFDDQQINNYHRFVKTDKKSQKQNKTTQPVNSQSIQQSIVNYKSSAFKLFQQQQSHQKTLLKRLTKISYIIKNKCRKINYQFFVKLEQYNKLLIREQKQNRLKQIQQKKYLQSQKKDKLQKGSLKLIETVNIINLKYIQSLSLEKTQSLNQAFNKIYDFALVNKNVSKMVNIASHVIKRKFMKELERNKKVIMKIQLFCITLEGFYKIKANAINKDWFSNFKRAHHLFISTKNDENNEQTQNPNQLNKFQSKTQFQLSEINLKTLPLEVINLSLCAPLYLYMSKTLQLNKQWLSFSSQLNFPHQFSHTQNFPHKHHTLKSHQQQINLNDCIDNGHLMMNQMKNNKSFKQELQNLTISKINSNTNNNSSLNSSVLGYEQLILPEFKCTNDRESVNRHERKKQLCNSNSKSFFNKNKGTEIQSQRDNTPVQISSDDMKSFSLLTTMRKTNGISSQKTSNIIKEIKKPRSSLVITKRKSSANTDYGSLESKLFLEKKNLLIDYRQGNKKSIAKSNASQNNKQSIFSQKDNQILCQKQAIRKMLQQLNKKYDFQNKTISINISNKKSNNITSNPTKANNKEVQIFIQNKQTLVDNIIKRSKKCKSQLSNQFVSDVQLVKNKENNIRTDKQAIQKGENNRSSQKNKTQQQPYTINLLSNSHSSRKVINNSQTKHYMSKGSSSAKKEVLQSKTKSNNKNTIFNQLDNFSNNKNKDARVQSSRKIANNYNQNQQNQKPVSKRQKTVSSFQKQNNPIPLSTKPQPKKKKQLTNNKKVQKKNLFMSITLLQNKKNQKNTNDFQKNSQTFIKKNCNSKNTQLKDYTYASQKNKYFGHKDIKLGNSLPIKSRNTGVIQDKQQRYFPKNYNQQSNLQIDFNFDKANADKTNVSNQYANYVPSNSYLYLPLCSESQINLQQRSSFIDDFQVHQQTNKKSNNFISQKNSNYQISNQRQLQHDQSFSEQQRYYTGSFARLSNKGSNIRDSLEKKKQSFEKSKQKWEELFQKQKNKLKRKDSHQNSRINKSSGKDSLQNSQISQIKFSKLSNFELLKMKQNRQYQQQVKNVVPGSKIKRTSLALNQSIISEIKSKIQKCIQNKKVPSNKSFSLFF